MFRRRGRKRFQKAHIWFLRPLWIFNASVLSPTCFCSLTVNRGQRFLVSNSPSWFTFGFLTQEENARGRSKRCSYNKEKYYNLSNWIIQYFFNLSSAGLFNSPTTIQCQLKQILGSWFRGKCAHNLDITIFLYALLLILILIECYCLKCYKLW